MKLAKYLEEHEVTGVSRTEAYRIMLERSKPKKEAPATPRPKEGATLVRMPGTGPAQPGAGEAPRSTPGEVRADVGLAAVDAGKEPLDPKHILLGELMHVHRQVDELVKAINFLQRGDAGLRVACWKEVDHSACLAKIRELREALDWLAADAPGVALRASG
jgi:hypothetical protein